MSERNVTINNAAVTAALQRLAGSARNPDPVLGVIGEDLTALVKQTFANSASPDGTPWAPNSEATIMALLSRGKGSFRPSDGRLSAKGARRVMAKKPLIGETHALATTIYYDVASGVLVIGSPMEYAGMQHFGGEQSQFPNLWGDIPARPFMPITPDGQLMPVAETVVIDAVADYLASAIDG